MEPSFKQKVYQQYLSLVNDKILALQKTLEELHESASNETKSTAGDKHETGLAMLQIEQETTRTKLKEATEQKAQLETLNIERPSALVIKGSLVNTNYGYFFISLALGKVLVDNIPVFAVSPLSPLGAKLSGMRANETTSVNNNHYVIQSVE